MIKRIKHYWDVGIQFLKMSIQSGLEYPVSLLGWCLSNPIQFIVGFATIRFVVEQFHTINGWSYEQLAFLYGLAVISHGISTTLFVQTWYLGRIIIQGDLDRFLLRPMNVLFQFLFMNFNVIGISDIIPGLCVFIYGCVKVHFVWTFGNTIALLVTIIGAALIRGAIFMVCGSVSFWTKSVNDFAGFTLELFDKTTMYPISMYPRLLQNFFTFILPLGWISYYPASAFLGKSSIFTLPISLPVISFFIGVMCFVCSCMIFTRGTKRYESAGS